MRIIFVRHGEPDYARDCLTPLGHLQAKAAADRLMDEGIQAVYSSPMGRARETARYTAERLHLPVQILDFMHELRWGSADGLPLFANGHPWDVADELARLGWDLTRADWPDHPLFARNLVTACADRVGRETDRFMASLGYPREGAYYRCESRENQRGTVAVFCHGGSSTAALARLLHLPFPYLCATVHLDFTGLFICRLSGGVGESCQPVIELCGDDRHIRGLAVR